MSNSCSLSGASTPMRVSLLISAAAAASTLAVAAMAKTGDDWPVVGHDVGGTRYSPLTQINPSNVGGLRLVWSYKMRPEGVPLPDVNQLRREAAQKRLWSQQPADKGPPRPPSWAMVAPPAPSSGSEFTPIVVGNSMFFATPFGRVVALDATSGKEKWTKELPRGEQAATRGLAFWPGDRANPGRLVVTLRSNKLLTLDPITGAINSRFGEQGILDLRTPDVLGNSPKGLLAANGIPVLYRNILIMGSRGQEYPAKGPRGDVRAIDIVTGKQLWKFNSIPEPGEKNFGTWVGDSWKDRAGVNMWNAPAVDEARGIAYLTFGTPAYDLAGVDRPGDGLYGTSIVAVEAKTGNYLWHFQTVHHDLWDLDMPVIPTLVDVKRSGRTIPAIAVMTKSALLFIIDRVTGKPLYDVREEPVPPSDVPGEIVSPTQPIPLKPAQLTRGAVTLPDEIASVTPEHTARCRQLIEKFSLRGSKRYEPIGYNKMTIHFPGIYGGVDWWGGAFDPKTGYFIINSQSLGSVLSIRGGGDTGEPIESGTRPLFWFADVSEPVMLPCQATPWGEIMAVNVSTGDIAWRRPLGVTDSLPEAKRDTGRPMMGGPMATASGLVFVAATDDERFRALDSRTGKTLWETRLKAAGHTTPITYKGADGKQYVALIATGGSFLGSPATSDDLVVYALP